MALKGTLKDFGIADILQLIGQQGKAGTLVVKNKGEEVSVLFKEGNIVGAHAAVRSKADLIGSMMVRAGVINESQLESALETQKRTLQQLGDILVAQGAVSAPKFKTLVQLQTSETLYRLFFWKSGTYAFEQGDVEADPLVNPLRAESVLMEGFRRVDEWPVVAKRITSLEMTFERKKDLPPPPLAKDDFDSALDDAFAEEKKEINKGEFQSVGENERVMFELVKPGRTAQTLIDLSCLGEFESCKALCNLINLEYLSANEAKGGAKVGQFGQNVGTQRAWGIVGPVAVTSLVLAAVMFLVTRLDITTIHLGGSTGSTYTDPAIQRFVSRQQMSRISSALEVYRLEHGGLPMTLGDLVQSGLLASDDITYPWRDEYYYRRAESGYLLLPPLR